MFPDTVAQPVLFADLCGRPLHVAFDKPHASSDGGAVSLKAADRQLALLDRLAATLTDRRDPARIRHSRCDLLAQRVYGIACGHADANDADTLAEDPIHKLLLDRDPVTGDRLASQPTLSRFVGAASPRTLYRLGEALADTVIAQISAAAAAPGGSPSISISRKTPLTARSNSRCSMASTRAGATCHCSPS